MLLDRLPGVAEIALNWGRHAAAQIGRRVRDRNGTAPFRYHDLGVPASISKTLAVQRGSV